MDSSIHSKQLGELLTRASDECRDCSEGTDSDFHYHSRRKPLLPCPPGRAGERKGKTHAGHLELAGPGLEGDQRLDTNLTLP